MASERAARLRAQPFIVPPGYARHCPEATLPYQLVERHYPELVATREAAGQPLPRYRHVAMTWAQRLKRVFRIEIEQCARCGGRLTVLASIEDPEVIARILDHWRERGAEDPPVASLGPRAPPPGSSGLLF